MFLMSYFLSFLCCNLVILFLRFVVEALPTTLKYPNIFPISQHKLRAKTWLQKAQPKFTNPSRYPNTLTVKTTFRENTHKKTVKTPVPLPYYFNNLDL